MRLLVRWCIFPCRDVPGGAAAPAPSVCYPLPVERRELSRVVVFPVLAAFQLWHWRYSPSPIPHSYVFPHPPAAIQKYGIKYISGHIYAILFVHMQNLTK